MNKLTTFAFIFIVVSLSIIAEVQKTPSISILSKIARIINIYSLDNNGTLPKGWQEMKKGYLDEELLETSRKNNNVELRYGFFPHQRTFKTVYPPERIIVMAIESGREGHRTNPEGKEVQGRWLIVETENNEMQTVWHSEIQLGLIFDRAGLDLSDYTGIEGNWLNKKELISAQAHKKELGSSAMEFPDHEIPKSRTDLNNDETATKTGGEQNESPEGSQPEEKRWLLILAGALLVTILALLLKVWKGKSGR